MWLHRQQHTRHRQTNAQHTGRCASRENHRWPNATWTQPSTLKGTLCRSLMFGFWLLVGELDGDAAMQKRRRLDCTQRSTGEIALRVRSLYYCRNIRLKRRCGILMYSVSLFLYLGTSKTDLISNTIFPQSTSSELVAWQSTSELPAVVGG